MDFLDGINAYLLSNGLNVVYALVILILGIYAAKKSRKISRRFLKKTKIEPSLIGFLSQLIYVLIMLFVAVATLEKLGVKTTSFIAVLGAAGFAVGLALQGSLSNFAAGVLILTLKPFTTGDFIEGAGVKGTVEEIQIFNTVLKAFGNETVIVPNSKLINDNVTNYSSSGKRKLDVRVGVAYDSDIQLVKKVMLDIADSDSRIHKEPNPEVVMIEFADSSINLSLRAWTDTVNYWSVYFHIMESIKTEFDRNEIEIPFPQNVVHVKK